MRQQNAVVQYLMVGLLVVGAYLVGVYKTKVEYLEKSEDKAKTEVAGDPNVQPEEKTILSDDEWASIQENPAYVLGDESAPITIVEFTDYECPFCSRFFSDTFPQIKEKYIDTGKVRYVGHDLPLPFHNNAELAAVSARCAGNQDKYKEMHDKLFVNHDAWSEESANGTDMTETFVGYAKELGLADGSFRACLSDEAVVKAVKDDAKLASSVGANGTPAFFINGKSLVGAQPFAAFETMIEAELK